MKQSILKYCYSLKSLNWHNVTSNICRKVSSFEEFHPSFRASQPVPRAGYNWLFSIRPDSAANSKCFFTVVRQGEVRREVRLNVSLFSPARRSFHLARGMKLEAFATCLLAPVTRARFVMRQMRKGWDAKAEPIAGE